MRALAICLPLSLLAFAFVAAPHSCEWGLSAYAAAGAVAMLIGTAGGFLLQRDRAPAKRLMQAALVVSACLAAWLAGFVAADFRLLCRLF
jgi:hypothetical protein